MGFQEVFNTVYKGAQANGFKPCRNPFNGLPRYRGHDGNKCAIGHLIPNELYSAYECEKRSVDALPKPIIGHLYAICGAGTEEGMTHSKAWNFLYKLQQTHDTITHHEDYKRKLEDVAWHFNLQVP